MFDECLKDLGVIQVCWSIMVYLDKGGEGLIQCELVNLMVIENLILVCLLDSLEVQGLIECWLCFNDCWVCCLYLIGVGCKFMDDLFECVEVLWDQMFDGISEDDIVCIVWVFNKILENVEK